MTEILALKKTITIKSNLFTKYLNYLPLDVQEKILSKKFIHDREISLFSQLLLRNCLADKLGIDKNDLTFETNEFGKPYLKNDANLFFNLSHSGDYIVLAISDSEVGVDVELERDTNYNIVEDYFSTREIDYFHAAKIEEQRAAFFKIWTRKESYIKAIGTGLSKRLNSFTIEAEQDFFTVTDSDNYKSNKNWNIYDISIENKYHLAICLNRQESLVPTIRHLSIEAMLY